MATPYAELYIEKAGMVLQPTRLWDSSINGDGRGETANRHAEGRWSKKNAIQAQSFHALKYGVTGAGSKKYFGVRLAGRDATLVTNAQPSQWALTLRDTTISRERPGM